MTDEFLTEGLRNDRYLKAIRLIDEFEDQIEATLREFGQRMVDEHPSLFEPNPRGDKNTNRTANSSLAHSRVDYPLVGDRAPEGDQRLNVHLYWVDPTQYDRTDVDGAIRAFGYKIKWADHDIDDHVADQTRAEGWSVRTSESPFKDSNVTFYRHVSSAKDIEETAAVLVEHFSEFGNEYATESDSI